MNYVEHWCLKTYRNCSDKQITESILWPDLVFFSVDLREAENDQSVTYSGRLGDQYTILGAQKTLFKFSLFSCISTKNTLKWRSMISQYI